MSTRSISKTKHNLKNPDCKCSDCIETIKNTDHLVEFEHLPEKKNTSSTKLLFDLCETSLLTHVEKILDEGEI